MATKRLTQEEIVREIAGSYTRNNRAYSAQWGTCCYTDKNGNHCAVGQCMLAKKRPGINTDLNTDSISRLLGTNTNIDHLLKEKYRGHGYQFWSDLQRLHDHEPHWTETGISDKGERFVLEIFSVKL